MESENNAHWQHQSRTEGLIRPHRQDRVCGDWNKEWTSVMLVLQSSENKVVPRSRQFLPLFSAATENYCSKSSMFSSGIQQLMIASSKSKVLILTKNRSPKCWPNVSPSKLAKEAPSPARQPLVVIFVHILASNAFYSDTQSIRNSGTRWFPICKSTYWSSWRV